MTLPKKQMEAMPGRLGDADDPAPQDGDKSRLTGLGKRAARMGRNPATGEFIKPKASKRIAFLPAKEEKRGRIASV
jgi:DNA-binding protein HU-beta